MTVPVLKISSQSRFEIMVPVIARTDLGAPANPAGDAVALAFASTKVLIGTETWYTAAWEIHGGIYYATRLIGLGTTPQLAIGRWWPFAKVTDSPEIPVLRGTPFDIY